MWTLTISVLQPLINKNILKQTWRGFTFVSTTPVSMTISMVSTRLGMAKDTCVLIIFHIKNPFWEQVPLSFSAWFNPYQHPHHYHHHHHNRYNHHYKHPLLSPPTHIPPPPPSTPTSSHPASSALSGRTFSQAPLVPEAQLALHSSAHACQIGRAFNWVKWLQQTKTVRVPHISCHCPRDVAVLKKRGPVFSGLEQGVVGMDP